MHELTFNEAAAEKRIDAALAEELSVPRSRITKLIKEKVILCNKKPTKPAHRIEIGDVASYPDSLINPPELVKDEPPELEILFEDEGLMVINKPAGLIVHQAGPKDTSATVSDALLKMRPEAAGVGEDPARPGVVHRLDRDVSGVMVLTKTQEAFEKMKAQFKGRTVEKYYLALAYGRLPHDHGEIKLKIARSKTKGRMVARNGEQEGKDAFTEYEPLARYKTATYAEVQIHTGRTHQIRVHFQGIGHPLVGDKLYARNIPPGIRAIKLDRIFLHSHKLVIETSNGERQEFSAPLPEKLQAILDVLPTK